MKMKIGSVKGTREFYPEDMALRNWLYANIREVSESFGFEEWDGPFIEKVDLYAAKSGEELVKKQSFVFEDRGGNMVTLRPELTPILARMVAQRQKSLVFPLRWWSFGPFWRYERPQKGRTREFFQWNIDIIGSDTPETDAELIAVCASFFRKVGYRPDQVQVVVNNRRLMDAVLSELEIDKDLKPLVFQLIDRKDKLSFADWKDYAAEIGLVGGKFEKLTQVLNDFTLWKRSAELVRTFEAVDALGLKEYVSFDPKIIRGLDYYTGTVFEAIRLNEGGRSILGGGRYDNLVADVGGDPLSGVGFALGDVPLEGFLREDNMLPEFQTIPARVMVSVFDEGTQIDSMRLSAELRAEGVNTIVYPEVAKLGKQFKYADRLGIRFVVVLGPDELENDRFALKDLKSGEQANFDRAALGAVVKELLATP